MFHQRQREQIEIIFFEIPKVFHKTIIKDFNFQKLFYNENFVSFLFLLNLKCHFVFV